MSNELQVFQYEGNETRVVMVDGEPWWVAKDVCDVLDISNSRDAVSALDDDEKADVGISDGSQIRHMNAISESGLYTLIMRSNKPEAKRFRKWVTSEVLPSIRKRGEYVAPQAKQGKAVKDDALAWEKIAAEKRKDVRLRAKGLLDGLKEFRDVMTPESRAVIMVKYNEMLTGCNMPQLLPVATEKWYTATELAEEFGTSKNMIGRIANENNLKAPEGESNMYGTWIRDKSPYNAKEMQNWVYYETGREWFREYFAAD